MSPATISMTEAKQNLGEVVNRTAYDKKRIMLLSRDKPKATLVSIEDLRLLERLALKGKRNLRKAHRREALAMADALRARILARTGGVPVSDSVKDLRQLREERLRELAPDL